MDNSIFVNILLNNAFDYLKKSSKEFEKEPKYSLINFCNAVEIFLKARLVKEHWSLILDPKCTLSYKAFKNGDIKTLDFMKLCERINNITEVHEITDNAKQEFDKLRKERNKLIHFTHNIVNENNKEKLERIKEEFAILEISAWYNLRPLLEQWFEQLPNYDIKSNIEYFEKQIRSVQKYIDLKYTAVKPYIDNSKKVIDCYICGKHSAVMSNAKVRGIELYKCLVCENEIVNTEVNLVCPSCKNEFKTHLNLYNSENAIKCECGYVFPTEHIINQSLEQLSLEEKKYIFNTKDINCNKCFGYHTVLEHNNQYICVNCGYIQTTPPNVCECCNEAIIGIDTDTFNSYIWGCGFCEGYGSILGII